MLKRIIKYEDIGSSVEELEEEGRGSEVKSEGSEETSDLKAYTEDWCGNVWTGALVEAYVKIGARIRLRRTGSRVNIELGRNERVVRLVLISED
ncbi:unnamed protein product, partial [Iphiclides podalirius]